MTRTKLWKKNLLASSLILALLLTACDLPAQTPTPTGTPGADTPTVTSSPSPSASPTATATATATQEPTATSEYVYSERLENGDFEQGFDNSFPPVGVYYGVADYWRPVVWRGFDIPRICEGGQTVGCNPDGLADRVPEYKPGGADPFRVLGGYNSQQWFCAGQHCFAGVAQDIQTNPGDQCDVSTWAMAWGAAGGRSNVSNELYRSDYLTDDDQDNMHILIVINPQGGGIEFPFPDYYLVADYGFADGIYDEPFGGAVVSLPFTATGEEATIAFIGYQIFPIGNANWYIDEATAWCYGPPIEPVVDIDKTPTPINPDTSTPVPTVEPTYTPTPDPVSVRPENADVNVVQVAGNFFPAIKFATFADHYIDWDITIREDIPAGNPVPIAALFKDPDTGELWFASDGHWQQHDVWDVSIWVATEWFPWYANGAAWAGLTGYRWFGYPITEEEIPDLPYESN